MPRIDGKPHQSPILRTIKPDASVAVTVDHAAHTVGASTANAKIHTNTDHFIADGTTIKSAQNQALKNTLPASSTQQTQQAAQQAAQQAIQKTVQQNLLADNAQIFRSNPAGASEKLAKLASNPFSFFRGTASLFYQRLAELTPSVLQTPTVLCNGDVHPENFGVVPVGKERTLQFGLNDFDEAMRAPAGLDILRGTTGFALAAQQNRLSKSEQQDVMRAFLDGYQNIASTEKPISKDASKEWRKDTDHPVGALFEKQADNDRKDFLKKYIDFDDGQFLASADVTPEHDRIDEFQRAINQYSKSATNNPLLKTLAADMSEGENKFFRVKDVARKGSSGTASLGMQRYWVLLEGPSKKEKDDFILEVKELRPSAISRSGILGAGTSSKSANTIPTPSAADGPRVVTAMDNQLGALDPFYGTASLSGQSAAFLVRERSPERGAVEVAALNAQELQQYARVCGQMLADAHIRSMDGKNTGKLHEYTSSAAFTALSTQAMLLAETTQQDFAALQTLLQQKALP